MMYNGVNSTIGYYRGKHDSMNSIAAGAISGAVFRSTRGVRPMVISGAIVGSIAGGWAVSNPFVLRALVLRNFVPMDHTSEAKKHTRLTLKQLTRKVLFDEQ